MKKILTLILSTCFLFCVCALVGCNFNQNPTDSDVGTTPKPFEEEIVYKISSKGDSAYLSYVNTQKTEIEILSEYEGVPVTEIGSRAFADEKTIENVIIPETITKISSEAFAGCENLKEIVIPDSVIKLGSSAFANCISLQKACLGDNLSYSKSNASWDGLFYNCPALKELSLPFSHTYDGYKYYEPINQLFGGPESQDFIKISQHVTESVFDDYRKWRWSVDELVPKALTNIEFRNCAIGSATLDGWNHLQTITLTSVTVAEKTFQGYNAPEITIFARDSYICDLPRMEKYVFFADAECSYYNLPADNNLIKDVTELNSDEDGFNYAVTKDGYACLFQYNGNDTELEISLNMLEGYKVNRILSNCFSDNSELKKISITDSRIELSEDIFNNCSALEEIETSQLLPERCINNCDNIKKIIFNRCNINYKNIRTIRDGEEIQNDISGNYSLRAIFRSTFQGHITVDFIDLISEIKFSVINLDDNTTTTESYIGISPEMFYNCDFIKEITFSFTNDVCLIKYIGESAFESCDNLQSLKIFGRYIYSGDELLVSDSAFYNCKKLTTFEKEFSGDRYEDATVSDYAFYNCEQLTTIKGIAPIEIGNYAFKNCASLTSLVPNAPMDDTEVNVERTKSFGKECFYGSALKNIYIGENTTSIGEKAFASCKNLEYISIPFLGANENEAKIFEWMFQGFSSDKISSIHIYGGNIAESAFFNYETDLINCNITLSNICDVGDDAFRSSQFKDIVINEINGNMGSDVFYNCSVNSIYLGKNCFIYPQFNKINVSLENTKYIAQDNVLYNTDKTILYKYPKAKEGETFEIPNTVKTISSSAFYGNQFLKKIVIPDNVTTISDSAFGNCLLEYIDVGNGVTTINDGAFQYCPLKTLIIGENVSSIGSNVVNLTGSATISNTGTQIIVTKISGMENVNLKIFYRGKSVNWDSICISGPDTIQNTNYTESAAWASYNYALYKAPKYWYSETNSGSEYWHLVDDIPTVWE